MQADTVSEARGSGGNLGYQVAGGCILFNVGYGKAAHKEAQG